MDSQSKLITSYLNQLQKDERYQTFLTCIPKRPVKDKVIDYPQLFEGLVSNLVQFDNSKDITKQLYIIGNKFKCLGEENRRQGQTIREEYDDASDGDQRRASAKEMLEFSQNWLYAIDLIINLLEQVKVIDSFECKQSNTQEVNDFVELLDGIKGSVSVLRSSIISLGGFAKDKASKKSYEDTVGWFENICLEISLIFSKWTTLFGRIGKYGPK